MYLALWHCRQSIFAWRPDLFEPDGLVIETLLAVRPVDQVVVLTLVFHVAVHALAEIVGRMHPGTALAHGRDFLVAVEAFLADVPAAQLVAVGAFFQTFEVGMGTAQRAG